MTGTVAATKDGNSIYSSKSYSDSHVSLEEDGKEERFQDPQAYRGPHGESALSDGTVSASEGSQEEEENAGTEQKDKKKVGIWQRLKDRSYWAPRKERRGVVPHLSLIPEFKDARDYPPHIKKVIVFIIAFSSMMGPMATNIIYPAIGPIKKDYDTSSIMVNISIGVYQISLGVFPLWWSSISEMNGRRTVYIISFVLLLGFNVGAALSPSIQDFTILRVCSGGAAASVQSVGAGTVSDLYIPEERGRNLGIYYMGPLMAPLLSPIIGAALVSGFSWRSTQWFMVILSGVNVVLLVLFLPETLRKQDNGAAIAAILQARRKKASPGANENQVKDEGERQAQDHEESYNAINPSMTLQKSNVILDEEDLERALSRTSNSITRFDTNHDMDPVAPQLSKIQSYDPRQEHMLREYEAKKMESNIQKELSRIETTRSNHTEHSGYGKVGQSRYKRYRHLAYLYLLRPLKSLYFLEYPPVLLAITFSAISFAILYFVNMTLEYGYSHPPYNFSPMLVGLMYIPNSVTYMLASIFGGRWTDHLLLKYKAKHGEMVPEARISWNVVTAVISFPISLVIFGWCLDKGEHWETPLVGTALFGYANMMTIGATVSYLVDCLPGKGATGVALNNLVRQLLAAVAVFVTDPMVINMSIGWAFTMLAFIIIGATSALIILKRYGDYWRETFDLERLYNKLE
ncbi:hypothetical protein ZYGR_0AF00610 [Zygosaccharomyces rouxii]|uniref:Major facilitator superfamily (MFS) profile domain-containing protein n=1 Tax=Zygosaccharomyces rouxii TaxID=4956 RepID=A0A1Q3A7Q4_ZYGRO|nr:hypothetical protein ZYGR_0AF00610 [Zygosaccharomyces rouxii]